MNFFIPAAKDDEQAREIYEATRAHVTKVCGATLSPRRIFRLVHRDWDKATKIRGSRKTEPGLAVAQVGEVYERHGVLPEKVICILLDESRKLFYICTWGRGVKYDGPILMGANEVSESEDFEP
jgi:hypothetical protein